MTTYIAFLRAVNVGGRKVEMARLRDCLTKAGCDNVRTYIASGNVFLDAPPKSHSKVQQLLEQTLEAEFGFEIPAMVRTVAEVEDVVARKAFRDVRVTDDVRLLVNFCASKPHKVDLPWLSPKGDVEIVDATDGEYFLVIRLVNRKWPSVTSFDKVMGGGPTTGRFAHTLEKIVQAAKK